MNGATRPAPGRGRRLLLAALTLLVASALSLGAAELILDEVFDQRRRSARDLPDYDAVYAGELGPGGLLRPGFSAQVRDGYRGTVAWTNDAQGFRHERDFAPAPTPGVLRILSLGDSFVAGYRVGQLDTFSRRLEEWSSAAFGPTEVLIGQIESPPLGVRYLDAHGWSWSPALVLLGLTIGNDIASSYIARSPQPITFAELEPLDLPAGARVARPATPFRDWLADRRLFQVLFAPRESIGTSFNGATTPKLFDGVNGLGMFLREPPPEIEEAYRRLFQVLSEFGGSCLEHGVPCAVLVFPQRFQIDPEDWRAAVELYGLRADAFDLRAPNRRIDEFCADKVLHCVDPIDFLISWRARTGDDLYLPRGDMHWNAEGHRVWLEGAKPELAALIKLARWNESRGRALDARHRN